MTLGKRIQQLRKGKGLTQGQLADQIQISVPQLVRYETKDVQPPADVLNRLADTLAVSIDFLVNGDTGQKAQALLKDSKLLAQFKELEQMNDADKNIVTQLIDAFIAKKQIKKIVS